MKDILLNKIKEIPFLPGCYLMKNKKGKIIYIGKAKNLNKRVKQYFQNNLNIKTQKLSENIFDIDYIITTTEKEAFLLENNLIKKYKPFYNIKLVDDKTYPYIVISDEAYPRIYASRKIPNSFAKIYGPLPSAYRARNIISYLNDIYPFRKCLKIPNKKCIYYDLKKCLGPCIIKNIDYNFLKKIKEIDSFLKGKDTNLIKHIENLRDIESNNLNYENSLKYQNILNDINFIAEEQNINKISNKSIDYIGYAYNNEIISLFILHLRNGYINNNYKISFHYYIEPIESIYNYLSLYYENQIIKPKLAFSDDKFSDYFDDIKIIKNTLKDIKLLNLATKNAKYNLNFEKELSKFKFDNDLKIKEYLNNMLGFTPNVIDAIDISQLFGTNQVGAIIRIRNNSISKKENRAFKLNYLENQNDAKAIGEVILKKYKTFDVPDLLLVDGGKIQVNAALKALNKLNLNLKVIGLNKNKFHNLEKLYFQDNYILLDKKTPIYNYFKVIDEQIHNYAINIFRKRQIKNQYNSPLDKINGLGEKRKKLLLETFKSIEEIKNCDINKLLELKIPEKVAKEIINKLNDEFYYS